jgi:hypothetical protein
MSRQPSIDRCPDDFMDRQKARYFPETEQIYPSIGGCRDTSTNTPALESVWF